MSPCLLLGWLAACNPRGEAAPPASPPTPGDAVLVQISSPNDFPRAQAAMSELMWSDEGGPAELRIQLAGARYTGLADLMIRHDPAAPTPVHLVVQGARSVFDGVGMDLVASSVDVDGVVFTGGVRAPALQVHTAGTAALSNLTFAELRTGSSGSGPARGGVLVLDAMSDGASARLDGCVFVGNQAGADVPMVAIVAQPGAVWAEVGFTDSVLAGNTFDHPIRAMVVRRLTVEDSVLAVPSGPAVRVGAPWVEVAMSDVDVQLQDGADLTGGGPAATVADTVRISRGTAGAEVIRSLAAAASAGPVSRATASRLLGLGPPPEKP